MLCLALSTPCLADQDGPPPDKTPGEKYQSLQKNSENKQLVAPLPVPAPIGGEEAPSAFESYIQSNITIPGPPIRQFGYDLFSRPPSTFAPADLIPIGPDYILGPGDELMISLWGKVNAQYNPVIDRNGEVALPEIGIIPLAGLTFEEVKALIGKEFSRCYRPSEVKVNISLGRLRSITVYVVGKVARPGSYTLSSLSTLINALLASGGPSKIGTLRDIQLIRNGKIISRFDLYDFLLKGDKTKDARLMPEDVIFVPPVGRMVGIAGNVRAPAIYELSDEKTVLDVIDMAGGVNGFAYGNRLQLTRIEQGAELTRSELDLAEIKRGTDKDFPLKDGDILTVFPVPQVIEKAVHIAGAVKSPGMFGFKKGMTVSELLTYSGGLLRYSNRASAELTRIDITPDGPKTRRIVLDLGKALAGDPQNNIALKEDDYLFVKPVPEWEIYRVVTIKGEVLFPGVYTIKKGETISSLVERAGGFTDKAYLKGAVFTRESVRISQQKVLDESVDRLEQQILSSSVYRVQASLSPEEVEQEKAADQQRRLFLDKLKATKAKGRVSIKLAPLNEFKGGPYDIPLEEDDALYIPERPDHVQVVGSVYNQTAFVYVPGGPLRSYIDKAGGMTKDADEDGVYVLKADGTAVSERESRSFLGMRYDRESHSWMGGGFMQQGLDPGDTVVVPVQTEKVSWMRNIKDVTQILFQIAVSAGVAVAAL